jgi:uncharacterized membrane protein (DUF106 family)
MNDIFLELFKYSPIVAVLVAGIIYLVRKEKKYTTELNNERDKCDNKLEALNKEMRETERENLVMLNKLADSLSHLSSMNKDVRNEIINLKEIISIKLDNLRDGRRN